MPEMPTMSAERTAPMPTGAMSSMYTFTSQRRSRLLVPRSTDPRRGMVNRLYTCRWVDEGSTKTTFFVVIPASFWGRAAVGGGCAAARRGYRAAGGGGGRGG